jgi:hypothetical protein
LKFDIIIKSHTKIKKILFSSINLKNDHFSQKEYLIEHFNEKPFFELPAKRKVINQLNEINANNENQLIHKKKKPFARAAHPKAQTDILARIILSSRII